jgi:hypothetical protein
MKFVPERGDNILYIVASDGQGNTLYEMGKVQAVIGEAVYLNDNLVVAIKDTLPCKKDVRELSEKVNKAYTSGKEVYGHSAIKEVA